MSYINTLDNGRVIMYGSNSKPGEDRCFELESLRSNEIFDTESINDFVVRDGELIYDPLPEPEPEQDTEPTAEDRIAALEEQNAMLMECLLEMSELVYA